MTLPLLQNPSRPEDAEPLAVGLACLLLCAMLVIRRRALLPPYPDERASQIESSKVQAP
jgi:hypothetical protein